MQLIFKIYFNLDENEKCIYIIHFYLHPKINENVIVSVIWKVVHKLLNIA
jgi:hypothetical protein